MPHIVFIFQKLL